MTAMFTDKKTGQMAFFEPEPEEGFKSTRLGRKFMAFHTSNPHIYESLKASLFKAIEEGRELYSTQIVTEQDRWGKGHKINNDYAPYYARLFIEDFPEYKSFFRLRKIKQD